MAEEIENELLEGVAVTRRSFVRKVVLGSAFAVPVIASFEMRSLTAEAANCLSPNQTVGSSDGTYKVDILNPERRGKGLDYRLKAHRAGHKGNISSKHLKLKLRSVDPPPKHNAPHLPQNLKFVKNKKYGRHYRLQLDTKRWGHDYYFIHYTVGDDPNAFFFSVQVGGC